ncbi:hypothetical protein CLTEP_08780 [Clostridium tepidiprofundi DSM 19306]|uniref:Uncharacterized protein n=1 Tax=Clostridium tepidiprofundi DSM 19306 TaxID=1121338 RepID=A0A151B631_9CLOT|nr:hypothetical protein CLTEP_08780 [Clostridium tepidiprofundi DSM 19306]
MAKELCLSYYVRAFKGYVKQRGCNICFIELGIEYYTGLENY